MAATNRAKRGKYRNVGDYIHNGEKIVGLKRRPNGRFYAARDPNKMFGADPPSAIHKFRQWETEQGKQAKPTVPAKMPSIFEALEVTFGYAGKDEPRTRMIPATLSPGEIETDVESLRWQERHRLRELILTNPRQAAIELDIPHLAYHPAEPAAPQITLQQLGERYIQEKRNKRTGKLLCRQEQWLSKQWWKEFLEIVKVKHAKAITKERILAYQKWVMGEFDTGKSPTYYSDTE